MPNALWRRPGLERIVLVGFMGAGKSTVAPLLAERLGWDAVDLDDRVRERSGRTAGELIREEGVDALRSLEAELTDEMAGRTAVVIAPGGGWALRPELAARLGPGTVRVWLRVDAEEAVRRVATDGIDRPLLGAPAERLERARSLLEAREPRYAAAEIIVDVNGKEPVAVVEEVLRRLEMYEREDD